MGIKKQQSGQKKDLVKNKSKAKVIKEKEDEMKKAKNLKQHVEPIIENEGPKIITVELLKNPKRTIILCG